MSFTRNKKKSANLSAFTLVELLVVISIMALLAAAIIANYGGTRSSRNLKIAENQLITYIRQAQSYSLSSRELPGNTPVQYYIMRFDTASSSQYEIQGMYNVNSVPVYLQTAQTITLPAGVTLGKPIVNGGSPSSCALVAFQLPYATILNNSSCTGGPPTANSGDDYQKFINFIVNNTDTTVSNNSPVVLTLQNNSGSVYVLINGITGVICPTANNTSPPTCLSSY